MITLYIVDLETEAGQEYLHENEINIISMNSQNNITMSEPLCKPKAHKKERRIGKTIFVVSTRFNEGKPCDIISKIARLIQQDNENIPCLCG